MLVVYGLREAFMKRLLAVSVLLFSVVLVSTACQRPAQRTADAGAPAATSGASGEAPPGGALSPSVSAAMPPSPPPGPGGDSPNTAASAASAGSLNRSESP